MPDCHHQHQEPTLGNCLPFWIDSVPRNFCYIRQLKSGTHEPHPLPNFLSGTSYTRSRPGRSCQLLHSLQTLLRCKLYSCVWHSSFQLKRLTHPFLQRCAPCTYHHSPTPRPYYCLRFSTQLLGGVWNWMLYGGLIVQSCELVIIFPANLSSLLITLSRCVHLQLPRR